MFSKIYGNQNLLKNIVFFLVSGTKKINKIKKQ